MLHWKQMQIPHFSKSRAALNFLNCCVSVNPLILSWTSRGDVSPTGRSRGQNSFNSPPVFLFHLAQEPWKTLKPWINSTSFSVLQFHGHISVCVLIVKTKNFHKPIFLHPTIISDSSVVIHRTGSLWNVSQTGQNKANELTHFWLHVGQFWFHSKALKSIHVDRRSKTSAVKIRTGQNRSFSQN